MKTYHNEQGKIISQKEYNKLYYLKHKEARLADYKTKVKCKCGTLVNKGFLQKHLLKAIHTKRWNQITQQVTNKMPYEHALSYLISSGDWSHMPAYLRACRTDLGDIKQYSNYKCHQLTQKVKQLKLK